MKNRIVFLVFLLALLPLGGRLIAQAPFKTYKCEVLPMKAHTFSADAKVFNSFNDGDSIFRLWLKPDGTTEKLEPVVFFPVTAPEAKTGNASLPDFYFGEKKMKYFGITGGGLVYFGETDELHPTYNPGTVMAGIMGDASVENFIYIRFYAYKGGSATSGLANKVEDAGILATANTTVKYEIDDDTLFVAYNDVKLLDTGGRAFVLSFQYAITKDGEVRFIPVAMQPQNEPNEARAQNVYYFNYGLFSKKDLHEGRFLKDLDGSVNSGSYEYLKITKTTYPNQTYRMYPPEACEKVEDATMQWSYTVSSDYIEFNNQYMTWSEGEACLFILSTESTLSGANLPVDGTEYSTGSQIGTSLFVMKGTFNGSSYNLPNARTATGLTPGTTYYLHAFPYHTAECVGFVYNTTDVPSRAITTALQPVNAISVNETSITENGFTLNIDKGTAESYVLAVSRRQMSPYAKTPLTARAAGYKAGDTLNFAYKSANSDEKYELVVLTAGTEAQFAVTDAQPNTEYYYYAWSTNASQSAFSSEPRTCAVATPYHIPAAFSFDSAAEASTNYGLVPAGWTLPLSGDNAFRVTDIEGQVLSAPLCPYEDGSASRLEALSPVIKGGHVVAVSVGFYFWTMPSGSVFPSVTVPRDGDTVYIQYKKLTENTWTTLSVITKASLTTGTDTVTTNSFYSSEDFRLRFVAVSTQAAGETGFVNAAFRNIEVAGVCKPISSVPEVSQIMHDRVTLSWEDENNSPRAEAYYLRCRASEDDAWKGQTSKNRNYTFRGLKDNTNYTMQVASVCSADTSDYVEVSFTTLHGLPYRFALASKQGSNTPDTLPEGVTLKTGALPASGAASFTEPDADKTVWAPMQKATNVYGAALTSGATLNNPLWLNLPVVSTGVTRGKARLSLKLSAWSAADATQAASFGTTDTLWVLFSTDNKFNRTSAKEKINLSELTAQGKSFAIDFDVENPYQYWALYTNLKTAGNVLFLDSLNIEWVEIYCDAATSLRQSNLSYYSVDISWSGEGEEYAIIYNDRSTDKWDTVYTKETTYTLDNLKSATAYQYYIVVYCDENRQKASDKSNIRYFQTEKVCEVPTIELVEGSETWQGVTVITYSNEQYREFQIILKDDPDVRYSGNNSRKDTLTLHGLINPLNVPWLIHVRAICSRDTSDWSGFKEFTTIAPPPCGDPTDLKAEVNVETQTATLSWKAGENNLNYYVYVRAGDALRRDTLATAYPSFTLNGIVPDVVYTWTVEAACEYPLFSNEIRGRNFGTNVGVESVQGFDKALKLRVFESQIIIENNEGLYIKSLQAFSTDGRLLKTYPVNSDQNVYLYHSLPKGAALLRVLGENGKTATYKTIIL